MLFPMNELLRGQEREGGRKEKGGGISLGSKWEQHYIKVIFPPEDSSEISMTQDTTVTLAKLLEEKPDSDITFSVSFLQGHRNKASQIE